MECHKLAISLEEIQQEIVQIKPDLNVTINQFSETEVYLDKILDVKQISPARGAGTCGVTRSPAGKNNNMFNKKHKEKTLSFISQSL